MMKERFERMTLDQLYAVRETLCYLSPPMENHGSSIAQLFADLDESHPSRGAWIEIVRNTTSPSIPGISRTPHGVRGLKSAAGPRPHGVCLSHPSRVRGLNCLTGAPGQFAGDAA